MIDDEFVAVIERVNALLSSCDDPDKREDDGGWSIMEVLGHLNDSVSNNHQRLLRYVPNGQLDFPGYDQELFVKRADYGDFEFNTLLMLWYCFNKLLLHIYLAIPEEDTLSSTIKVGDRDPVTISNLMKDYLAHVENHERQIQSIINS
jgi:hypothetical protein